MRLGEFLWIGIFGACLVTYLLTSMSSHFYKRSVRGQLWREVSGSTWSAFLDAINPELAQWKNRQKQQPSSREVFFLTYFKHPPLLTLHFLPGKSYSLAQFQLSHLFCYFPILNSFITSAYRTSLSEVHRHFKLKIKFLMVP